MTSSGKVPTNDPVPWNSHAKRKGSGTVASLELMRGLASLDVFLWHALNGGFFTIPGLYRLIGWSRESVIVFFVLSGYVISLSQQRKHRSAGEFFKARIKRILPIYLIALAAALVVGALVHKSTTAWQVIGHLLFLQSFEGSFVPTLATNGPLWSLGTEFEFYFLFTIVLLFRRPGLLVVWWAASIGAVLIRHVGYGGSGAGALLLEFLGLSPCWLIGYFVAGLGAKYSLTLFQAIALFLMVPMVSWSDFGTIIISLDEFDNLKCFFLALLIIPLIHTLAIRQLYPDAKPLRIGTPLVAITYAVVALYALTHAMTGFLPMLRMAAVPGIFLIVAHGFLPQTTSWPINTERFRRIAIFMGGASYALYAIHTPIMFAIEHYFSSAFAISSALLVSVIAAVFLLEFVVQPIAAGWIDRAWNLGRRPAPRS